MNSLAEISAVLGPWVPIVEGGRYWNFEERSVLLWKLWISIRVLVVREISNIHISITTCDLYTLLWKNRLPQYNIWEIVFPRSTLLNDIDVLETLRAKLIQATTFITINEYMKNESAKCKKIFNRHEWHMRQILSMNQSLQIIIGY